MTSNQVKEPVITLSAGPVAAFPRVLRAMSRPVHYDFDPYFQQFYENVTRKAAMAMKVKHRRSFSIASRRQASKRRLPR